MTASKQLLVKQRYLQDDPQTGLFFFNALHDFVRRHH